MHSVEYYLTQTGRTTFNKILILFLFEETLNLFQTKNLKQTGICLLKPMLQMISTNFSWQLNLV